jgi:hypothetical protein
VQENNNISGSVLLLLLLPTYMFPSSFLPATPLRVFFAHERRRAQGIFSR